jgi:hypothetical protein
LIKELQSLALNIELLDKDELEEKEQAIRSKYEEVLKLE